MYVLESYYHGSTVIRSMAWNHMAYSHNEKETQSLEPNSTSPTFCERHLTITDWGILFSSSKSFVMTVTYTSHIPPALKVSRLHCRRPPTK